MKPFEFNLQSVLTLRQREEKKALEVYAKELLRRQQARLLLTEMEAELDRERVSQREIALAGCSANKLVQAQSSYRRLSERRDSNDRSLGEAERRVNAALATMLALRQQRRIVDKYYDKRRAEYDQEIVKNEQKESDELAGRGRLDSLTQNVFV